MRVRACSQLAETTADLADEHSAAAMVSERLHAELAERQRLEKELHEAVAAKSRLADTNEQLEMQLLCMRSSDPSLMSSSSSVAGTMSDDDSAVANSDRGDQYYRRRYERVCRELEYAKKRLQQQHNDDMEQLLAMKKQLEKKVSRSASGLFVRLGWTHSGEYEGPKLEGGGVLV